MKTGITTDTMRSALHSAIDDMSVIEGVDGDCDQYTREDGSRHGTLTIRYVQLP